MTQTYCKTHYLDNSLDSQTHFLCTRVGPHSWYSSLVMNDSRNLPCPAARAPPIHAECSRSGGQITLTSVEDGAKDLISLVMRLPMPSNNVLPPASTMFSNIFCRISRSVFMMDVNNIS